MKPASNAQVKKIDKNKISDRPKKAKVAKFVVQAKSAGYDGGNYAKIQINQNVITPDKNENCNYRGLHMVVLNPKDGKVLHANVFDTYKGSGCLKSFMWNYLADGDIIIVACMDECVTGMTDMIKDWFKDMGSKEISNLGHGEGFVFIGEHGGKNKDFALEKRSRDKTEAVEITKVIVVEYVDGSSSDEDENDDVFPHENIVFPSESIAKDVEKPQKVAETQKSPEKANAEIVQLKLKLAEREKEIEDLKLEARAPKAKKIEKSPKPEVKEKVKPLEKAGKPKPKLSGAEAERKAQKLVADFCNKKPEDHAYGTGDVEEIMKGLNS